jgi:hypothetical protein
MFARNSRRGHNGPALRGENEMPSTLITIPPWWDVTWATWVLVGVGIGGTIAAVRTLRSIEKQTVALQQSVGIAINSERAWVMVDLEKAPGGGFVATGTGAESGGAVHHSTRSRIRCVRSNQGKTPARIVEKRACLILTAPDTPLPKEPNIDIDISRRYAPLPANRG